jgi:hypothetical protein
MFDLVAKILTINVISEKSAQIVVEKQIKGKKTPIAINVFGFWKEKLDSLNLQPKEKIEGRVYAKSNLYKGKWYTDLYFKGIDRYVGKPKFNKSEQPNLNLFHEEEKGINYKPFYDENGNIIFKKLRI